jgi:hypothetical protein
VPNEKNYNDDNEFMSIVIILPEIVSKIIHFTPIDTTFDTTFVVCYFEGI